MILLLSFRIIVHCWLYTVRVPDLLWFLKDAVTMKIILLCLVARPTKGDCPNLSIPSAVILLIVVFAIICTYPPGLYAEGDLILLVAATILELGSCLCIVLINSYLVCDWLMARLCSANQMMSACILDILSRVCLNCLYFVAWADVIDIGEI